jgi:hypothetical protein
VTATLLEVPAFASAPQPEDVILLDAEVENYHLQDAVTVLGWYKIGEKVIRQLLFSEPFPASTLAQSPFFRGTFVESGVTLGAYYAPFEAGLFGIEVPIEVMSRPYAAKENYIAVESLSTEKAKDLPKWAPDTWPSISFHNVSCVVKIALLYLGRGLFASPEFQLTYEEAAARAFA